jgi:hypothetical protein
MSRLNGFKKFVEEMDPTPEKQRTIAQGQGDQSGGKEDYFGALGDEQGIEWKDMTTIFEDEPWVSSHFGLGAPNRETMYKLAAWQIVPGSLTPNGADIRVKPQPHDRSYLQGNRLNKSKYQDKQRYHLSRQELVKFLTTGWTPAVQQAQGGMPGADPMMGGMPPAPAGAPA